MAKELKRSLAKYEVRLARTEYAGHAEKLAYKFAKSSSRPLIISASGDGGYHEVINGLIRAQLEGSKPTAGLLPAGNANDHYHDVHDVGLVEAITAGKTRQLDLIKLTATTDGKSFERYAHSYIGFGLTPKVGKELNRVDLNRFNEILIVLKALFSLQPVKVIRDGKRLTCDSLVFSNISKMSKVLSLSKNSANDDGKFEITIFRRRNKLRLIKLLLKASTSGLTDAEKKESYTFQTIKKILVQVDGEISAIDANSKVSIDIERKILNCIV